MSELTLVGTGDVYLETDDPEAFIADVRPLLADADFAFVNLEGPASDKGVSIEGKAFSLRMPPAAIDAIAAAGVDAAALANNHGMDWGEEALFDTLERLDRAGIARAGGGHDAKEAWDFAIVEGHGLRIAFLSFTFVYLPSYRATDTRPGLACVEVDTAYLPPRGLLESPGTWPRAITTTNPDDKAAVLDKVREARDVADLVVVNCHWGLSGASTSRAMGIPHELAPNVITDYQHEMGRALVDAGVDLVIGNHPHRLQGVEIYNGVPICYSLGNFAFAYRWVPHFTTTSAVVRGTIDAATRSFTGFTFVPVTLDERTFRPSIARGERAAEIARELQELSAAYGTTFEVSGDELLVRGS